YEQRIVEDDLCYVSGEVLPRTEKHTNKIRNAGDKAKLISANDDSGFTYRGRFKESLEVASISYDVSQKAHNALKWLINRQAKIIDQRVFLVWGNKVIEVPPTDVDSYDFSKAFDDEADQDHEVRSYVYEEFAKQVAIAIEGYRSRLKTEANINILVLDAATTGRLAVLYYRNMDTHLYLSRLETWHKTCVWEHRYRKNAEGKASPFWGTPATKDIAFAAYGPKASDKVVKGLMERMLPCILDGRKIPFDIKRSAIQRASNPVAYEKWEWEKILSITCALINKEEEYGVALDKENNDRSYLFGRLLAIADVLERSAMDSKETRATNAIRYMNSFSRHPERTWQTIQASLQPYQAKLGSRAMFLSKLIDEVAANFEIGDFNNKPLNGKYLLGFYSQRHDLYQKKESKEQQINEGGKE
ncbi:MAG: type I-C CRISPR-associated protein Cas8c/Csd1, partial [Bacillaceae bacterium]|nr:type I-C CRISPR-associated protein Cas8c/Csd1 [Bacillaceae bacterium]